jgi:nucleotide-binding universal stress UspA family protein
LFPTRILLATDGSAEAVLAEEAAAALAAGTGSELHVVYVVSTVPELPYPRAAAREQAEAMLERRRLTALRLLDLRVRRVEELGGSVAASHYREGNPEKEVIRLGEELDVGLIMTGGKKRPRIERLFGAGFSERVLRKANRPVLVVGERRRRSSTIPK